MIDFLVPRGLIRLRDILGNIADYDPDRLVFAHGNGEGVLELRLLSIYCRGGHEAIDQPYHVEGAKQPLTQFYNVQLAIKDILEINSIEDAARILAAENVLVAPSMCEDLVDRVSSSLSEGYSMLNEWKHDPDPEKLPKIISMFEDSIVPAARIRVPEVKSLFDDFLHWYEKPKQGLLQAELDRLKRDADRSISDAELGSGNTIFRLRTEFECFLKEPRYEPLLRYARLMDTFARNHIFLGFKNERVQYYDIVRTVYTKIIDSPLPKEYRISAYASLILFDKLLEDAEALEKDWGELKELAPKHPKTQFIEHILFSGEEPESKLKVVGLDKNYHPDLLEIMQKRVDSYMLDSERQIPFPIHRMEALLDHAKKTLLFESYKVRAHGKRYRCLVFNQNPYISFKNPSLGFNDNGNYVVLVSMDGSQPNVSLKDCKRYYSTKNPHVEKLVESDIDKYLLSVPLFMDQGHTLGSSIVVIPRNIYAQKMKVGV